jgi:hypothetical protein
MVKTDLDSVMSLPGPSRWKAMSAPMSAMGVLSGLILLTMSFVGLDPQRPSRGQTTYRRLCRDLLDELLVSFFEVGAMLVSTKSRKARTFAGGRWRER